MYKHTEKLYKHGNGKGEFEKAMGLTVKIKMINCEVSAFNRDINEKMKMKMERRDGKKEEMKQGKSIFDLYLVHRFGVKTERSQTAKTTTLFGNTFSFKFSKIFAQHFSIS